MEIEYDYPQSYHQYFGIASWQFAGKLVSLHRHFVVAYIKPSHAIFIGNGTRSIPNIHPVSAPSQEAQASMNSVWHYRTT